MKQKIIFLDFDGVMSSQLETPGSYITHDANEYGASPTCLKLLKQLCDETNSKIVISSNWRRFEEDGPCSFWTYSECFQTVFNPLPKFKKQMEGYIIGTLPKDRHLKKSQALILWFEENNLTEKDLDYVIFDDDLNEGFTITSEYGINRHFIRTSNITGLTNTNVDEAKKKLLIV